MPFSSSPTTLPLTRTSAVPAGARAVVQSLGRATLNESTASPVYRCSLRSLATTKERGRISPVEVLRIVISLAPSANAVVSMRAW